MTKQKPKKFGKPKSFSKYSNADPLQKTSLLSKVFGNQKKLDDARDSFFSSYDFESNVNPMRLISLLLLISTILLFQHMHKIVVTSLLKVNLNVKYINL